MDSLCNQLPQPSSQTPPSEKANPLVNAQSFRHSLLEACSSGLKSLHCLAFGGWHTSCTSEQYCCKPCDIFLLAAMLSGTGVRDAYGLCAESRELQKTISLRCHASASILGNCLHPSHSDSRFRSESACDTHIQLT